MENQAANNNVDEPTPAMAEFDRPIVQAEDLKIQVFNTLREHGVPVNRIKYGLGHLVIKTMRKSGMVTVETNLHEIERAVTHVLAHLQQSKERR